MMPAMRIWLFLPPSMGALAVIAGAFAAHALDCAPGCRCLSLFETGRAAIRCIMPWRWDWRRWPCAGRRSWRADARRPLFLAGIILFSGSLYLLALTGIVHVFAYLPPLGGLALSPAGSCWRWPA